MVAQRRMTTDYFRWFSPTPDVCERVWSQAGGRTGAFEMEDVYQCPCTHEWRPEGAVSARVATEKHKAYHWKDISLFMARKESTELVRAEWWFVLRDQRQHELHQMLARHFRTRVSPKLHPYLFGTSLWEEHGKDTPRRAVQIRDALVRHQGCAQIEMYQWAVMHGMSIGDALSGGLCYTVYEEGQRIHVELALMTDRSRRSRQVAGMIPVYYSGRYYTSCEHWSRACVFMRWSHHWCDFCVQPTVHTTAAQKQQYMQQCVYGNAFRVRLAKMRDPIRRHLSSASAEALEGLRRRRLCLCLSSDDSGGEGAAAVWTAPAGDDPRCQAAARFVASCEARSARVRGAVEDLGMILVGVYSPRPKRGLPRRCACEVRGMEMVRENGMHVLTSNDFGRARCPHMHNSLVSLEDLLQ